eukprot:8344139-Lingulodinium_polyedra.AAC.1
MATYEKTAAVQCMRRCFAARTECPRWDTSKPYRVPASRKPAREFAAERRQSGRESRSRGCRLVCRCR